MHEATMRPTGPISYLFLARSGDRPAGPAFGIVPRFNARYSHCGSV